MTTLAAQVSGTTWAESIESIESAGTVGLAQITVYNLLPDVAVPVAGLAVAAVNWAAVSGATGVEVSGAGLTAGPATSTTVLKSVPVTAGSNGFVLTVPAGFALRSLHLDGLKAGDLAVTSTSELSADRRLVVRLPAVQGAGFGPPVYTVPAVSGGSAVPQTLGGASYQQSVLRLPDDLPAGKVLIMLTDGDHPTEFSVVADVALAGANAELVPVATDLVAKDPAGAVVWSRPGPLTSQVSVDLTAATQRTLSAALTAGTPLSTTFTVSAGAATTIGLDSDITHGTLVRAVPGTLRVTLAGDPVRLDLGAGPAPLAAEKPGSVSAFLTVRYLGIRLSELVADVLPDGVRAGVVVGAEPVRRVLPPAALLGDDVVRIGVIGRAPVDAELSVQLLDPVAGAPLGPPGIVTCTAGQAFSTVWLEFGAAQRPAGPVVVALTATQGRFLWATGPSPAMTGDVPLVRIAIADPDPGGRPIRLAGANLPPSLTTAPPPTPPPTPPTPPTPSVLDPAAFTGPALPILDSALFVTVEFSSLTLRYPR